jgi:hypothetical protein
MVHPKRNKKQGAARRLTLRSPDGGRGRQNAASPASARACPHLSHGFTHLSEVEDDTSQLRQLSEEVGRIARTLALLSESERHTGPDRREGANDRRETDRRENERREVPDRRNHGGDRQMPTVSTIRAMIRARRLRDQYFSGELFADPAWDMLLDLLLARMERRTVAVSSLCIAAAVPPTTALRWIKRLTEEGIFVRTADPRDGRRVFIDLSEEAADGMAAYIRAVERIGVTSP